jgi:hypothetical protein
MKASLIRMAKHIAKQHLHTMKKEKRLKALSYQSPSLSIALNIYVKALKERKCLPAGNSRRKLFLLHQIKSPDNFFMCSIMWNKELPESVGKKKGK